MRWSFAEVLSGQQKTHRSLSFGMHNNVPEGPPYTIRSVNKGRYHYIRNLRSDDIYIEKHLMGLRGNGNSTTLIGPVGFGLPLITLKPMRWSSATIIV